jgi:hypothetical protein
VYANRCKYYYDGGRRMNGDDLDKWSERHVGSLALTRTILGFLNLLLGVVVVFKLFGVI